jgi:hypothetical protein
MNTNLHPVMVQALRGFMGSMGMYSSSPTADAEDHFDAAANTFEAEVEYLGLTLTAEVTQDGRLVDLLQADGTCWMEELSERALRKILFLAQEGVAA